MNTLGSIRQTIFDRLDWEPSGSPEAVRRINGFINDACQELAQRAPYGFAESSCRVQVDPDVGSASDDDTVARLRASDISSDTTPTVVDADGEAGNPWVLRTEYQKQLAGGAAVDGPFTPMLTDRSWDARVIILKHPDGHEIVNRIRTVWAEAVTDPGAEPVPLAFTEYRMTLVHPMPTDLPATGWTWKVVFNKVFLPQPIVRLKSLRERSIASELRVITTDEADEAGLTALEPTVTRDPRYDIASRVAYRLPPEALPGLATAPAVEALSGGSDPWRGPEPPGRFRYKLTLGWGKANAEPLNQGLAAFYDDQNDSDVSALATSFATNPRAGRSRMRRLLMESAPSPESEEAHVQETMLGEATVPPGVVKITLPNIEYVLGFFGLNNDGAGNPVLRRSLARSGLVVNIYRQRITEDRDAAQGIAFEATKVHRLDVRQEYQLLAQVRIDGGNEGIFIDDGTYLPDRSVPLTSQGIHSTFGVYPRVPERKVFDVRYVASPALLENDSDTLHVTATGREAVLQYALALASRMLDRPGDAASHMAEFRSQVKSLAGAVGTLIPKDHTLRRQRVRRRRRR